MSVALVVSAILIVTIGIIVTRKYSPKDVWENDLKAHINPMHNEAIDINEAEIIEDICKEIEKCTPEQREQVEAAVDMFIHGNGDGNNPYYASVTDIPVDVLLNCVEKVDDSITYSNHYSDYTYSSIEDQIDSYR